LPRPRMVVVGGPPGSGKTSRFPITEFGLASFNADNRAAELNAGSFRGISKETRSQVNLEFQQWILNHISEGRSFAIETTLRSDITFEQAQLAREHGFQTAMYFVTTGSVEESIRRIKARAYRGGHSASERVVRQIYEKSMGHLATALDHKSSGFDTVDIYDNSANFAEQKVVQPVLSYRDGEPTYLTEQVPEWLEEVIMKAGSHVGYIRERLDPGRFRATKLDRKPSPESGPDDKPDPDRDTFDLDR